MARGVYIEKSASARVTFDTAIHRFLAEVSTLKKSAPSVPKGHAPNHYALFLAAAPFRRCPVVSDGLDFNFRINVIVATLQHYGVIAMKRLQVSAPATVVPVKLAEVRQLVDAGAVSDANTEVIGVKGGYTVRFMLRHGKAARVLATKEGALRIFSTADSALRQLRAVEASLGNVVVRSSTYQPAALRPGRDDRRQAMQQASDYGRWLKAETDATLARVASGAATIYTQVEFDQRSAKRRAAIVRRRNEGGA